MLLDTTINKLYFIFPLSLLALLSYAASSNTVEEVYFSEFGQSYHHASTSYSDNANSLSSIPDELGDESSSGGWSYWDDYSEQDKTYGITISADDGVKFIQITEAVSTVYDTSMRDALEALEDNPQEETITIYAITEDVTFSTYSYCSGYDSYENYMCVDSGDCYCTGYDFSDIYLYK